MTRGLRTYGLYDELAPFETWLVALQLLEESGCDVDGHAWLDLADEVALRWVRGELAFPPSGGTTWTSSRRGSG